MKRLSWWIITLFLFFLPFQEPLQRTLNLSRKFLWMDEIFVAFCIVFFFFALLYQKGIKKASAQILFSLILLGSTGVISGLYNTNAFIVTANGVFDYIKYFLIIPALCLFSVDGKKMQSLYSVLHRLALFLCFIAILQEIFFFLGLPVERVGVIFIDVRFGLMRTPSLMGHPNIFGLYSLLFFTLDFGINRRVTWQNLLFSLGIALSVSRMVWIAFFLVVFFFAFQMGGKRALAVFIISAVLLSIAFPAFYSRTTGEMYSAGSFREYVMYKSVRMWKAHPLLGIGPGMYGGVVSMTFDSPVYGRELFNQKWMEVFREIHSLDQFWPQILVETGVVGAAAFVAILFTLWHTARKQSLIDSASLRGRMLYAFSLVPMVLAVYLLGSGLNLTAFLLTYSMLFGMVLGVKDEDFINQ